MASAILMCSLKLNQADEAIIVSSSDPVLAVETRKLNPPCRRVLRMGNEMTEMTEECCQNNLSDFGSLRHH
jgi:hypothetical protein